MRDNFTFMPRFRLDFLQFLKRTILKPKTKLCIHTHWAEHHPPTRFKVVVLQRERENRFRLTYNLDC